MTPILTVLDPASVEAIELGTFPELPPEVDWMGFDNYGCWNESWSVDADGFGHGQERLSNFILRHLGLPDSSSLSLPSTLPTVELLKHCFPRGARVPHQILLRPLQPAAVPAALPKAPVGYRLAPGLRVSAASSSTAAAAVPKVSGARARLSLPGPSAGWEPRTRADHRLVAALAKARPP